MPEDQYLVGDWTGDGKDKLAVRRGNKIYYQQGTINDTAGVEVSYGNG
jgi:lactocepin